MVRSVLPVPPPPVLPLPPVLFPEPVLSSFEHAAIMQATQVKASPPLILLRNSFLSMVSNYLFYELITAL
jgi:hypothetical protein